MVKKLVDEIIYIDSEEKFNDIKQNYKREQKIYYTCSKCGKAYIKSTIRLMTSFNKLCRTCATKKTILEKYGVENPFQVPEFKEKIKETNKKRYGSETPFAFGQDRYKQRIKEKYGVDNVFQLEEVKEKIKNTCIKKYGVEYSAQATEVKEKIKNTCIKKYGVESVLASPLVRQKIENTNMERYGQTVAYPFNSEKYKAIIKEKYGVDNVSLLPDIQLKKEKTCLEHFGVANPFQANEIKEKIKATMIQKYGVEHALQFDDFFKKAKTKYKYNNLTFDSSWELSFWIYNKEFLKNNIKKESKCFTYTYNNIEYKYFPDFEIDGQFYEIKGDHFFENGKMINPWNRKDDGKAQAKYICMLKNNVNILKFNEIKPYIDWVNTTYGIDYLNKFRRF